MDKISKSLIDQGHTFEDVNINKQLPSEIGVFKSGAPDLSKLSLEEIRAYTAEAKRLGVDAYIVVFNEDASRFWVYNLSKQHGFNNELSREKYFNWLKNLHDKIN